MESKKTSRFLQRKYPYVCGKNCLPLPIILKVETEGYHVRCSLKRENFIIVDLTIAVPTEEAAAAVCMNWKNKSQDIYENLIDLLL